MNQSSTPSSPGTPPNAIVRMVESIGALARSVIEFLGGCAFLLFDVARWIARTACTKKYRFGRNALYAQIIRIGARSIGVIVLVSSSIGLILALQMAPPLDEFGQSQQIATIIGIAVIRELGPLISAIVLTGFAGAAIAAELGTMKVGEEIEALEAHALNPTRFLVMPRVIATTISLIVLTLIANFVALASGWFIGVTTFGIPSPIYIELTFAALDIGDLATGLTKAAVFGVVIGLIACYNGLCVRGGAAGVGLATTRTVVFAIVALIITDLIFTAVFFKLGIT